MLQRVYNMRPRQVLLGPDFLELTARPDLSGIDFTMPPGYAGKAPCSLEAGKIISFSRPGQSVTRLFMEASGKHKTAGLHIDGAPFPCLYQNDIPVAMPRPGRSKHDRFVLYCALVKYYLSGKEPDALREALKAFKPDTKRSIMDQIAQGDLRKVIVDERRYLAKQVPQAFAQTVA